MIFFFCRKGSPNFIHNPFISFTAHGGFIYTKNAAPYIDAAFRKIDDFGL